MPLSEDYKKKEINFKREKKERKGKRERKRERERKLRESSDSKVSTPLLLFFKVFNPSYC